MPSAMVSMDSSATGCPALSDTGQAAAPAACTATIRTSGRAALTTAATPATKPPPPAGTTMVPTSGSCSRISSPTVACPATTSRWSNGWMSTAPVSAANSVAANSASSMVEPVRCTVAPYARVATILGNAAPTGMNTVDGMPRVVAAQATPWA
ncbi:Uncharacterised protein [Mycobacteroides abscessus subsp. abscessus]|nr:Uncharacterised protein [Mycobacteroides abscessus subsp. abscessus]